ncbi:MAG TPA: LuxR C-terminal-related transcriptional regulator [Candidatus Baltobacteraceae bacterium]|nr:LuxR C-terminal-related transcriptional regulator [Candidatus Baltobacteraceae bacterium]
MPHVPAKLARCGLPDEAAALERTDDFMAVLRPTAEPLAVTSFILEPAHRAHVPAITGPPGATAPTSLVERELAILRLIAEGQDNVEIARALHFSLGTIKAHVRTILCKLETTSRTAAAVRAVRFGLI